MPALAEIESICTRVFPPFYFFFLNPKEYRFAENYKFLDDELTLECRVKCFPPAKITWLKDNVPIRPINRFYQTELADGVCRLTICSPDGDVDNGKYTCRAEHDVWTEHSYYFLNFQGSQMKICIWRPLGTPLSRVTTNAPLLTRNRVSVILDPQFGFWTQ